MSDEQNIFDWKESECSTVWNLYREAELKKFRIPKDSEEVDIDSLPWYKRLFHRLSSFNQRLYVVAGGDNEPLMPLRKYIIWLQRSSLKIEDAEIVDPVAFQRFFIRKVRNTAVFVLAINFLVLINLVIVLQLQCFKGSLSPKSQLVSALCGYFGTWAFINFMCLLYFIVSAVISREKMAYWGISMDGAWLYLGRCVLLIWFAIIAQDTIAYVTSKHSAQCYGIDDIGEKSAHVFWYIFATTLEDGIQSLALSCMPFPWPWGAVLAILMFYQTVLRTVTCSEYLAIPIDVKGRVIEGFNVFIFVYYLIIVSLTSYTFRRSVLSSYSNAVNQRAIAHNTRAMVDLLCTDVKVNVRRVLKTLDSLSQYTPPTVTSFAPLATKMKESGVVINTAVDHLIFLAKLGEGRFEFFMEDKIVVSTALVGVCKDYKRKVLMDNRNIDIQVELSPDHLATDARCLNALVYYGLMAADAYVQAMITRAVSLGRPTTTCLKQFFVKTQLESPHQPSEKGLRALRIVIFFENIDPSATVDESKQIVNDNAVIHSCCIVCHRLVQSYEGEFRLTPNRLECTLPVIPLGPKSPAHPPAQASRLNRTSSLNSISTTSRLFFAPQNTYRDESARNSAVLETVGSPSPPAVPLGQLLSEYTSMYLTLPNVESLVIDALHSLLQTQDPLNITIHRILNPVDLKIRAIVFVQTSQARHELMEAGFNGDIVLCSEKAGYLDARERALFSFIVSLPPSKDELHLLHRFLMRRLQRVHRANSSASDSPPSTGKEAASPGLGPSAMRRSSSFWGMSPAASLPSVAIGNSGDLRLNNSSTMADIVVPPQSFGIVNGLRRGWSWILQSVSLGPRLPRSPRPLRPQFSRHKPARLAPPPSPSLFSRFFNAGTVTVPEHQLDNFAKWRFMNPGGDIYHHTTNVEFFTCFMGALFGYEWVKGLGSVRIVAISLGWAVLLVYRKSIYFALTRFLSFLSFWIIFSFVNSAMAIPVTFASVGRIIAQNIRYHSVEDLFMDRSFVETMIRNGIQIVFALILLPLNLKYFSEFLSWPISLITIVSQIGRGFFFVLYVFEPFLQGFIQRLVMALLIHLYLILLINIISSEALFRDEFCQLHELIVARSYLEKCLVLARQLVQPLENVLDAQEELLDCIVTEAVGGRVLVHELFLGAMRDIQLSSLMMEHLHLDLRMTREQDWLMQQERSVLIGRMRTVLLPCVVQDVCACFQEECYGLGIQFCMRFAPEVTQIRVEESLLRTTLAELCRRALEHIQEHLYLARKWSPSSDYWAKQLNRRHQMLLWVYPVSSLAAETGRPYRFTDIRDFEILVMTSADATPDGYTAMRQQHEYTGEVTASFFTSAGVPLTMDASVELLPFDRNPRTYYRRSMADLYAEYFGFVKHSNPQLQRPTASHAGYRRERNHEEGLVLRHASYRSYQRVLLPYLLTPRSIWFAQDIIKSLRTTAQVGKMLDSSSSRYYATYVRFAVPHFQLHVQPSMKLKRPPREGETLAPLPPSTVAGATMAAEPRINRITLDVHQPSMAVPSTNANAAASTTADAAAAAVAAAERRGARKKSTYYASPSSSFRLSPNSSLSAMAFAKFKVQQAQSVPPSLANTSPTQSSSVLAMNLTGVSMANLAPLPYASTIISTARSSSEASTSTSDGSDDDASAALALLAATASPSAARPPISFRAPGMHVAVIFSFPDTPLRQQAVHNQLIFGAVGWLGRLEMLRPPAMPLCCPGAEVECVFLEYVAPPPDSITTVSLAPRLPPSPFRSFGFNHQPIAADMYFSGDSLDERLDNGRDYLRLVIQCLRYRGYEGLIVLVGPESVAAAMQADTYAVEDPHTGSSTDDTPSSPSAMSAAMAASSPATKPLPPWTQRVAVKADRFLTTPLTEEKLQSLIPDCERRIVELALGVWRMHRR